MTARQTPPTLTPAQARALITLVYLYDINNRRPVSPRQFAKQMWPDSPAWDKRTSPRQQTGAMGGTMPMNGAKMLWRLKSMNLASIDWATYQWSPTAYGREVLTYV